MVKAKVFGLLSILMIVMTTSLAHSPAGKVPPVVSKEAESSSSEEKTDVKPEQSDESLEVIEDNEQMLCNVIVRATHDLYIHQRKSVEEIIAYLEEDCKTLENEELIEQCRAMVEEHANKIYEHVKDGTEMSEVCKKIEDNNEIDLDHDRTAQCSHGNGDKCKCCVAHVKKRKMRLRFIVKLMARKRMHKCEKSHRPHQCRAWIRRKKWHILKKIHKICPFAVCKHLGYCKPKTDNGDVVDKTIEKPKMTDAGDSPSLWFEMLDQQLEAHMTKDVCPQFEKSETLCVHIAASVDSRQYAKIYTAVIDNDTKWIANSLQKEAQAIQKNANADLCDTCKNVVQSSTTLYLQILAKVGDALHATCEHCPAKEKCKAFFDQGINTIDGYLRSIKSDAFCSTIHLCSLPTAVLIPANDEGKDCNACVQRLQPRKDAAIQVINQLSSYFTNLCAEKNTPECQQFISEIITEVHSFINEFDVKGTCLAMDFCGPNAAHDVENYEHAFVEEIGKNICSTLGPFETLCQQIVQSNTKSIQPLNLNTIKIDDFLMKCEEEPTEEKKHPTIVETNDHDGQDKDKCKCCINRVIQKKKCFKKRVAKFVAHMIQVCKRSPAQKKCEQHWEKKKECWDAKIDKICPKKACIHMGFCKKGNRSSVCANMGPFQKACEQAFSAIGQFTEEIQQKLQPPPAVITNSAKEEKKKEIEVVANKL